MRRSFPITAFIVFFGAILAATFIYAPQWGLMDDIQNLYRVNSILHSASPVQTFWGIIWGDAVGWGIFRPVYHLWVLVVYGLWARIPTAIYILVALINMCSLLIWGRVLYKFYDVDKENFYPAVYLFPLSFFLFTPFWNIFMYISLQEKFVVLFSALSFYFFKKSYETVSNRYIGTTFLFLVLGLFSKPTALAIAFAYSAFALLDYFLFKIRPAVSLIYFLTSSILVGAYFAFTLAIQSKKQYTAPYVHNLKPMVLIGKILAANLIIKFLFLLGAGAVLFIIIRFILTKDKNGVFAVLLPLGLLAFLTLLAPWGYQSYLICDLAPFVLGIFFPVYIWLIQRNSFSEWSTQGVFIVLLFAVFIGIIIPRISKMAEIVKIEYYLTSHANPQRPDRYFYPYVEAAGALKYFTGEDVIFWGNGELTDAFLTDKGNNYLLVNDDCSGVSLKGIRVSDEIFSNKTWQIFRLVPEAHYAGVFNPHFKNNLVQEIKTTLRNL